MVYYVACFGDGFGSMYLVYVQIIVGSHSANIPMHYAKILKVK